MGGQVSSGGDRALGVVEEATEQHDKLREASKIHSDERSETGVTMSVNTQIASMAGKA